MPDEPTTEIVSYQPDAPAIQSPALFPQLSREKVELVKRTIAADFTDDELEMFLHQANRTGLDPLSRQIYAFKKGGRISIGSTIDGLRLVAARTGRYVPGRPTEYEMDGERLISATAYVKVLVAGEWHEVSETAYYKEYTTGKGNWLTMPRVMTAKCAEARALRRAFPAELSGIYEASELDQMDNASAGGGAGGYRAGRREPRAPRGGSGTSKTAVAVIAQWDTKEGHQGVMKTWARIGLDWYFTAKPALMESVEAAAYEKDHVIFSWRKSNNYREILGVEIAPKNIPETSPPLGDDGAEQPPPISSDEASEAAAEGIEDAAHRQADPKDDPPYDDGKAISRSLEAAGVSWNDAHAAARELGITAEPRKWTLGEVADIINKAIGAADNPELQEG